MKIFKYLFIIAFLVFTILFFISEKTFSEKKSTRQSDSVKVKIFSYIYLGETDNEFFIPCRIEEGEVIPEILLDAVSKTGKRFTIKIDKIEKYLFTNEFLSSAKTGDSVNFRAHLHSGNASGFNHEDFVLVNIGAPYFDAIKK